MPRDAAADAWRRWLVLVLLVLGAIVGVAALVQRVQPQHLPPASAARVPCVSYAPFRRAGHSPFNATLRVQPKQIEADLRQLATITGCVRTYGLDHGLDAVPAIARRLGLRVVLGAWIGRDDAANDDQLRRAVALAREYADVIELLIVGNEVLLRRELTAQALAVLLARARRESPVPVTYADVWEFWLRHAAVLKPHVDLAAVHVLPYWEDHPVDNAAAAEYVHTIAARLREAVAPLPVWVAETGWPAEGRQRGAALPGRTGQTRFIREMIAREQLGGAEQLHFNLIEGFDQPWKRRLEGAMGGYWGWFDAEGRQRVQPQGPMPPDEGARLVLTAVAIGAVLGAALAGLSWGRLRFSTAAGWAARAAWLATWMLGLAGLGACAVLQWQALQVWSRSAWETGFGLLFAIVAVGSALMELPRLARHLAGNPAGPMHAPAAAATHPLAGCVAMWRGGAAATERWRASLFVALLFCSGLIALQLVFDGRYRPLLWPIVWVSAAVALSHALLGERFGPAAREERLLAAVCAAAAVSLVWIEGAANGQALVSAASWLALAAPAWPRHGLPFASVVPAAAGRTHTSADNSRPAAAGPAE